MQNSKSHFNRIRILIICLALISSNIYSQKTEFNQGRKYGNSSIGIGHGFGFNLGENEFGLGQVVSLGWQKSKSASGRFRFNPHLLFGRFKAYSVPTDVRRQLFNITSLGIDFQYDLIKTERTSLVTSFGGFINYTRGMFGTGGTTPDPGYFAAFYYGASFALGIRYEARGRRLIYEFRPINLRVGNNGFFVGALMFKVDYKLAKKAKKL